MNKKLFALAGLLAVCGFMTGCSKKACAPRNGRQVVSKDKKNVKKKSRLESTRDFFRK
jgi:hypothetical protein